MNQAPASPATRSKPRWPRIWGSRFIQLLAFVALVTVYRFLVVHISGISLFFDEAQYWDWSRHLDWGYYSKPPFVAGLIWLSTQLFGSGVLGVKALGMLTYPATALAMVGFARALWPTSGGVRTGIVAGALYMTLPMVGLMGLVVSTDGPLILCWTLASWSLWRAQLTNRMSLWALCGLICGVGIMDKYTMAAFALTAIWTLWGVHGPQRGLFRKGPWVTIAVAALVVSPNIWWNVQNHFPTFEHTAQLTAQSGRSGGIVPTIVFLLGQVLMLGPVAVWAGYWLYKRPYQQEADTVPASQWAASSQMLPRGQFAAGPDGRPMAKSSAYYFASVSSYRFLWATSLPLLLIAIVQALHADAHVNWAAPSMVGLTLLIASRLSPPLVPLATPKPNRWLVIVLASNLLLTGVVVHLHDLAGGHLPNRWDVMVRMRGWHEAFADLAPVLDEPTVKGLPVMSDQRLLLTEALYEWRDRGIQPYAWNPGRTRQDHYQFRYSFPDKIGQDVILLTDTDKPNAIARRFGNVRLMKSTKVMVAPDRAIELHVFLLRGFLGYSQQSYDTQSGTLSTPSQDD
ncbi:ArnT family glycosyltransferase [Aquabacterium sp.]|uniref:ArnT family glycosyltransferase n=1 Tax=Aquabacterium sp. TaxID=1872578 RepID=UPI002E36B9F4|nr:glycosyltransferase family 39 protein [Aquabacterium sp.]HEX5313215.1 glycosyltransferase family 39 protein [Aquabacterium sp.]